VAASNTSSLKQSFSSNGFSAPLYSMKNSMDAFKQHGTSMITADTQLRVRLLCDMVAVRVDWRNRSFSDSQSLPFCKAAEALPRYLIRHISADWSMTAHPNVKLWEITG
jgi:hypothetical protein